MSNQKSSRVGFWLTIAFLAICLFISLALNAGLAASLFYRGGGGQEIGGVAEDESPRFTEKLSYGGQGEKVVRIPLNGIISREDVAGLFSTRPSMADTILRQVRAARNDSSVRAIILEVNSPGGEVPPTDEIYHAMKTFRESREDRRVIVFVRGMAASGGYYASMAADWIVAEPTSVVGSIGVILQTLNWSKLSEKIGVEDTTVKAGDNKDILNPFRETNPEHLAMLQAVIDDIHGRFIRIVADGRSMSFEAMKELADGRIFSATRALELKLIDETGYWDDVLSRTRELLDCEQLTVVRYTRPTSMFSLFGESHQPVDPRSWFRPETPQFRFLWQP
jgi:protease IV